MKRVTFHQASSWFSWHFVYYKIHKCEDWIALYCCVFLTTVGCEVTLGASKTRLSCHTSAARVELWWKCRDHARGLQWHVSSRLFCCFVYLLNI